MQVPKVEDMPWLTRETQEDVQKLHELYELLNKDMVPMHELVLDKAYRFIYVTDSGVNPYIFTFFSTNNRQVQTVGDVFTVKCTYVHRSLGWAGFRFPHKNYQGIECSWSNYGRSWRLHQLK